MTLTAAMRELAKRMTPGPWFTGPTPVYLGMHQFADGKARRADPVTIRSPAHSEEIATIWTYLLPTEANAQAIALADLVPRLVMALEDLVRCEFNDTEPYDRARALLTEISKRLEQKP